MRTRCPPPPIQKPLANGRPCGDLAQHTISYRLASNPLAVNWEMTVPVMGPQMQEEGGLQRASQIASNTLKFHKQPTKPTITNMVQLVESVLGLFKGKLAASKVAVKVEPRGKPELTCFAGEIKQVLANLIGNALDAMPSGGRLRVRVRPSTDWRRCESGVRVTVADTGVGMSTETRRRIYDPFFTTKGTSGTGLGLWVTAGILARHRGSMHLRSKTTLRASGTAFTLILPMDGVKRK